MKNIVITGCSSVGNLGYMIAKQIKKQMGDDCRIIAVAVPNSQWCETDLVPLYPYGIDVCLSCDLSDTASIKNLCDSIKNIVGNDGVLYALVNCAGMNMNSWFEDSTVEEFDNLMNVNAKATYQMTQNLLEILKGYGQYGGTVLNIVSNAAQIPMRCSLAYNASKAAAKMITKQMAHELTKKYGITVFSVSPNKLKGTEMSKFVDEAIPNMRGWTPEASEKYQNEALTTGVQTDPNTLAEFIAFLLSTKERHFFLSGCDIQYGA
tara:strand:- start:77 stop:868 length:792 start_codon:yes stop_codon:yes gene_type:complete